MKKILKSRFFIAAFCIVLEFTQLIAVFTLLYRYFLPIAMMGYIFHFGVLLYILNKDEIPEFKLPWLIIILVFPVIGAFVFMLFSSHHQSKKEIKKSKDIPKAIAPYLQQNSYMDKLKKQDKDAWLQANYLYQVAKMPCRTNSDVTYYYSGEKFYEALLYELKKAEHFIFMEYFIIEKGLMWDSIHEILKEKARYGVKVCLLYDDFGCMTTLPEQYYKELTLEGIDCIPSNKFTPVLSYTHNNRDHRKITVIDGKIGFTGGINLADEYINAIIKYGHWKDTAVKIEGQAVKNLTILFLSFWNIQSTMMLEYEKYINVRQLTFKNAGVIIPYGDGPSPMYKDNVGKNVYLNMINGAKEYVYITTPYLICDYELMAALRNAAKKGVDICIITPHIPDKKTIFLMTRSNYEPLIKDGVKIFEYTKGFIHAKNFISDDKFAICGTINLDYRSLVHHFECGTWIYNMECIKDMKIDFVETMNCSEFITLEKARLKGWQILMRNVMKVFSPLL